MFILKSTHLKICQELSQASLDQQAMMREGYLSRVLALEDHISDLKKLVFSPTTANYIPELHEEADKILTQNEVYIPTDEELKEADDILRERDRLFSGSYDEIAINE